MTPVTTPRCSGGSRDSMVMTAADRSSLEDLSAAVMTIESLLPPEHRGVVTGVIYVAPRDMAPQLTGGVHVVGRLHLASLLVGLPQQLSPIDVADITHILSRVLGRPVTPMVDFGGGAISTGTMFFPTASQDTAAYFNPRALPPELEPGSNFAPTAPAFPTALFNRFGNPVVATCLLYTSDAADD